MAASPVYTLIHDDEDIEAAEACIPRVSLDCSVCHQSFIYCHVSSAVLTAYVDPKAPTWLCPDCAVAS